MKIHIVLPGDLRGWIIAKAADRLAEFAGGYGAQTSVSEGPDKNADLNHWMSYAFANSEQPTPSTMLITHPDDPFKVRSIRDTLTRYVDVGICMSSETVGQLAAAGTPRSRLCYVLFGHDGVVIPRRIVIGITTRLYPDGRKREAFLVRLANDVDLSAFTFRIFGAGWEAIVERLRGSGAQVELDAGSEDYKADYGRIADAVPSFDYYLYLGMDEGSLGTLDALAGGIRTIVTDQGFHKDLTNVLTHRFVEYESLLDIFCALQTERANRLAAAAQFTWQEYARRHVLIWRLVLAGRRDEIAQELTNVSVHATQVRPPSLRFRLRALSPVRILSAVAHYSALESAVNWFRQRRRPR
jgi:hypothetical protein